MLLKAREGLVQKIITANGPHGPYQQKVWVRASIQSKKDIKPDDVEGAINEFINKREGEDYWWTQGGCYEFALGLGKLLGSGVEYWEYGTDEMPFSHASIKYKGKWFDGDGMHNSPPSAGFEPEGGTPRFKKTNRGIVKGYAGSEGVGIAKELGGYLKK